MGMLSIEELQAVDGRSCVMTPAGMRETDPETANRLHQEAIQRIVLVDDAGEQTRSTFERLKLVYAYGLLCYELYTLVEEQARLILELALRERFISFYGGQAQFFKGEASVALPQDSFETLREAMWAHRGMRGEWRIALHDGQRVPFKPSLLGLLRWARDEELLRGQFNRFREEAFVGMRNLVAHPEHWSVTGPSDALYALRALAEIVNHLYGATTPGGERYPPPVDRRPMAYGWSIGLQLVMDPTDLPTADDREQELTYAIVLMATDDRSVPDLDTTYEASPLPVDLLWGPGSWTEACGWASDHSPEGDEVDPLDRWFIVRKSEPVRPQRPEVVAGLEGSESTGSWVLVKADDPFDVVRHVRHRLAGESECPMSLDVRACRVQQEVEGDCRSVLQRYEQVTGVRPVPVRNVPLRVTAFP